MSSETRQQQVARLTGALREVIEGLDDAIFDELRAEAATLRSEPIFDEAALAEHRALERRLQRARRALERAVRELEGGI
jgi:hypothetical protein